MRRIVVLLSVVALMVVMLAMSAVPAFAAWYQTGVPGVYCRAGDSPGYVGSYPDLMEKDRNADGWICVTVRGGGNGHDFLAYYDNHQA